LTVLYKVFRTGCCPGKGDAFGDDEIQEIKEKECLSLSQKVEVF
jgi:hypothetical protein